MTRTNACNFLVDFTANKVFKDIVRDGAKIPFCRVTGFVRSAPGSRPADGVRFLCYGTKAYIVFAAVQRGTRAYVISHVQTRTDTKGNYFTEFVIEDIQFIRGWNEEELARKTRELIDIGAMSEIEEDAEYKLVTSEVLEYEE